MFPRSTSPAIGRHTFQMADFLSFHPMIKLLGYPSISSTGVIFMLLFPKLRIVVKTKVLAKAQSPFIKNAQIAAMIQ